MNTIIDDIDYGPLAQLIGKWVGTKGLDIAPDNQAQADESEYTDELIFTPAGFAENAEQQQLVSIKYHHQVRKNDNGLIFHDQIGHWIYEAETGLIMHSLTIPRGVCVLAGGKLEQQQDQSIFAVKAEAGNVSFGIIQSPFMLKKAKTTAFAMIMTVCGDQLNYQQTTSLHIYGKDFEHKDQSIMQRIKYDLD
jgi:hypothetical protein